MSRSCLLLPVLLTAVAACGPEEDTWPPLPPGPSSPPPSSNPVPPPPVDTRNNVTGAYEVTGTMRLDIGDESDTGSFRDVLRVTNRTGSISALQLTIASFRCGPRGAMTGERTFSIESTSCPMPPDESCTYSMDFETGSGSVSTGTPPRLQLSMRGRIVATCGGRTANGAITIEMSGPRSGQALPDAQPEALSTPAPLRALLEHAARAASL